MFEDYSVRSSGFKSQLVGISVKHSLLLLDPANTEVAIGRGVIRVC